MHYQLVIEARGRTSWFHTTERMRATHRLLGRILGPRMLLFGFVDEHGHVVVDAEDRAAAGHLGSGLNRAFLAMGAPIEPTRVTDVEDARHLGNLIGYAVRQPAKHAIARDPAGWEGTCLADLVGARLGCVDPGRIGEALPRIDVPATALAAVGLGNALSAATDDDVRAVGAREVWAAAHAVFSAEEGRSGAASAARRAYVAVARGAGLDDGEVRAVAGVSKWAWYRLISAEGSADHAAALRRQLGLRALIQAHAGREIPEHNPRPVRRWLR